MEKYQELEKAWANYVGMPFCSACSSGTTALHLALASLNLPKGSEVIVPEFTMIATAWAVSYNGLKPVFVDCGDDLNIDVSAIEEKITPKTMAIIPTHIYGRPADMKAISKIAKKHNLFVIEDACEAHGATIGEIKVGSWGDIGCFSLYRNKIINSEEGGLITFFDKRLKERADDLKSMCFGGEHNYYHKEIGFNFRLTNMQAEVALQQVAKIDDILEKRKRVEMWYHEGLKDFSIFRPKGSVLWMYDIVLPDEETRDRIYKELRFRNIQARLFFKPMSMQPMYLGNYRNLRAYDFSKRGLYLPVRNDMTELEVKNIIKIIKNGL